MIEIFGFFFILIFGTLSHFFYEWSGHKKIFALFFAVNESSWEHIKLAIGPTFIWMLIEIPFINFNNNFLLAKLISLLIMIIFIPTFYYICCAILKKNYFVLNILDFILAIALGQIFSHIIYNNPQLLQISFNVSGILILIILIMYLLFTYFPPKIALFSDPINKKYGIKAHMDYKEYIKNRK